MTLVVIALTGLLLVASARFWRIGTWAALVLMIYEGALRKWLLPHFQEQIYFLKDVLLAGAYVGCFFGSRLMRNRPVVQRHVANVMIAFLSAFCLLQLFNPRLPEWTVGLYGFASYLFYIPLMYMVPDLLPDEKTYRKFAVGLLVTTAVPLVLGVVQFNLPAEHTLNRYVWSDQAIATFGADVAHPRVTSTFSYITGYSVFLTAVGVILLALALIERVRLLRVILFVALTLTFADMLMTGSRGAVVQFAIAAPAMVLFTMSSATKRYVNAAAMGVLALVLTAGAVAVFFPEAQQAFTDRVASNESENLGRVSGLWTGAAEAVNKGGLGGYGIGSTLPGSSFLYDAGNVADAPPWVEADLEHVMVETGVIGFLLTVTVRLLVGLQLYRTMREFPRSSARPLLAAALVFVVINLPMQIIVSRTAGMLYWFMAGFTFLPGRWAITQIERVYQMRPTATCSSPAAVGGSL